VTATLPPVTAFDAQVEANVRAFVQQVIVEVIGRFESEGRPLTEADMSIVAIAVARVLNAEAECSKGRGLQ